jgi:hypothetical protein
MRKISSNPVGYPHRVNTNGRTYEAVCCAVLFGNPISMVVAGFVVEVETDSVAASTEEGDAYPYLMDPGPPLANIEVEVAPPFWEWRKLGA